MIWASCYMPSMVFEVFLRAIYTFKTLNCTVAYGLWGDFWHLGGATAPLPPPPPPPPQIRLCVSLPPKHATVWMRFKAVISQERIYNRGVCSRGWWGVRIPPQLRSSFSFHIILKMIATMQWLSVSSRVHQIRFRPGLDPPWTRLGELTALPQTPSWLKGALLLRGRKGKR